MVTLHLFKSLKAPVAKFIQSSETIETYEMKNKLVTSLRNGTILNSIIHAESKVFLSKEKNPTVKFQY